MKTKNENSPLFILASSSPRRMDLLQRAGITHAVYAVDVDETPQVQEQPTSLVARLSQWKADAAAQRADHLPILGADTMVVCDGAMLGKPAHEGAARQMLQLLSGKKHDVLTGYHVRYVDSQKNVKRISRIVTTKVDVKSLSEHEIEAYVKSEEWRGKAGSYAIQGRFSVFVRGIEGNYENIVGLPLMPLVEDLVQHGLLPVGFPNGAFWV